MRVIGRLLQFVGLTLLPLSMFLELNRTLGRFYISDMLLMLIFGFAIFYLGRIFEGMARTS